jgi:hypothetical protein
MPVGLNLPLDAAHLHDIIVGILSPAMRRGIDSRNRVWNWVAKLHMLAGRYDNPMPTWFLAHTAWLKLPAQDSKATSMRSGLETWIYRHWVRGGARRTWLWSIRSSTGEADLTTLGTWFERAENGPRATRSTGDPYNLKVRHGRLDQRMNFLSIRVIEDWNRIPAELKRLDKSETFRATYLTLRANQMDHAARWDIRRILYMDYLWAACRLRQWCWCHDWRGTGCRHLGHSESARHAFPSAQAFRCAFTPAVDLWCTFPAGCFVQATALFR